MYLLCRIVQIIILKLLLIQPIFSELIRLNDGEIIYEFNKPENFLGSGKYGNVYSGIRIDGNRKDEVVFKELIENNPYFLEDFLNEKNIYEMMGYHDSIPRYHHYFPKSDRTGDLMVIGRIGKDLEQLWDEFRPFSVKSIIKIAFELLDALEWMHGNGFTHNDLHGANVAINIKNESRFHLYDLNFASKKKSETSDLSDLAHILVVMARPSLLDRSNAACFERYPFLKEFSQISKEYTNIHDARVRTETLKKLRNLLNIERAKLTNYEESDFSYDQGAAAGMNQLRDCIKKNNTSGIDILIKQGVNINAGFGGRSYFRPIHLAALLGNAHMVQFLIDRKANVNIMNTETSEISPLHYAAAGDYYAKPVGKPNKDVVRILVQNGANVHAKCYDGKTPLHLAAQCDDENICKILLEKGADSKVKDKMWKTPFMYCNYSYSLHFGII